MWVAAFGPNSGERQVLHLFKRLRIDMTRGVPYLAPVIEPLKMLDRYAEAELMAAVVSSFFTVFVKSEGDDVGMAVAQPAAGGVNIKTAVPRRRVFTVTGGFHLMLSINILPITPVFET